MLDALYNKPNGNEVLIMEKSFCLSVVRAGVLIRLLSVVEVGVRVVVSETQTQELQDEDEDENEEQLVERRRRLSSER
jgi:hypothetical protein